MLEPQIQMRSLKGWRAEVGMLAPLAGMYREWDALAQEGVRFSSVVLGGIGTGLEFVKKMAEQIEAESKKLNIANKCDLICLGCTSGSFAGGEGYDQMLIERIERASGSPATTATTCVLELFKDMRIKKIALVGPYPESTFDEEIKFLKANGIVTLYFKALGFSKHCEYWDYYGDPYPCYKLVREAAKAAPKADCVFVTCMMSTIMGIVDTLEKEIGKPVISSSSATLYGILKKLGIPDQVPHYGQALMRERL